jgi:hypothetical protein
MKSVSSPRSRGARGASAAARRLGRVANREIHVVEVGAAPSLLMHDREPRRTHWPSVRPIISLGEEDASAAV